MKSKPGVRCGRQQSDMATSKLSNLLLSLSLSISFSGGRRSNLDHGCRRLQGAEPYYMFIYLFCPILNIVITSDKRRSNKIKCYWVRSAQIKPLNNLVIAQFRTIGWIDEPHHRQQIKKKKKKTREKYSVSTASSAKRNYLWWPTVYHFMFIVRQQSDLSNNNALQSIIVMATLSPHSKNLNSNHWIASEKKGTEEAIMSHHSWQQRLMWSIEHSPIWPNRKIGCN